MNHSRRPAGQAAFSPAPDAACFFPSASAAASPRCARIVEALHSLHVAVDPSDPRALLVRAEGEVATLGWSDFRLDRRIHLRPPLDGIYEADLVGMRPGGDAAALRAPFTLETSWPGFPRDRLRGLRVRSATNSLTALLI